MAESAATDLHDHAIIIWHGRVGSTITPVLRSERQPFIVIGRDQPRYESLAEAGLPALFDDATQPDMLRRAGIDRARLSIIASPDSFQMRRALEMATEANPGVDVIIRTHSETEHRVLVERHAGHVILGEHELARAVLRHALRAFGVPGERARFLTEDPAEIEPESLGDRR